MPAGLLSLWPVRTARPAERRGAGCAQSPCHRLPGRTGARRHCSAPRLLAHPRIRRLRDLGRADGGAGRADVLGFHAAIFLTGHYGPNWQDLKTLLEMIQPHVGTRLYGLPDFEANQPGFDNDNKSGGDHAGKVETSLLWAVRPECVDVSRIPPPDAPGPHFAM